jgi:hypothetical protein
MTLRYAEKGWEGVRRACRSVWEGWDLNPADLRCGFEAVVKCMVFMGLEGCR